MLFDSAMLARICADSQEVLPGCRVRRVVATGKLEVAVETSAQGGAPWLVVCAGSEFGRVHLAHVLLQRGDVIMRRSYFNVIRTISDDFPVLMGGPQDPTPLVV